MKNLADVFHDISNAVHIIIIVPFRLIIYEVDRAGAGAVSVVFNLPLQPQFLRW